MDRESARYGTQGYRLREADIRTQFGDRWIEILRKKEKGNALKS